MGAVTLVSLAVIFLPVILDGEGYRHLSAGIPEKPPGLSIIQQFPDLEVRESEVVVTRERVDASSLSSEKNWFVHVADHPNMDAAVSLVRSLVDGGYKASYRMISREGQKVFTVEIKAGASRIDGETIAMKLQKEYGLSTRLVQR